MLIVILVALAFSLVVGVSISRALGRQRRLPSLATSLGCTFEAPVQKILLAPDQPLPFVPVLGFAPVGWISNLMRGGGNGTSLAICDYQTAEMDNPRQTLYCLDIAGRRLPSVAIVPVGSLMAMRIDRHAAQLAKEGPAAFTEAMGPPMTSAGQTQLSFDTAPRVPSAEGSDFSKHYEVRTHDPNATRQLLTPALVDYFLRHQSTQPHLVTTDRWLVIFHRRRLTPVSQWAAAVREVQDVFAAISATRTAG